MNISVCITTLNEEGSVGRLLDSLLAQSKKPDRIIIVDGGSTDKTIEIIRHYQKKDGKIKLLTENCSRARGRNLAVEISKDELVVMTDAGCTATPDWIKNITEPFRTGRVDVVAGFYKMTGESSLQKAESVFLGVRPRHFDIEFLPSTRSMAFTKEIWERAGGFPENLEAAGEDTVFNYKLIKVGARFSRMKNALVEWGMPLSISEFSKKIYEYARGDAKSKIWFFPGKGLASHNIKALLVLLRYIIAVSFLILGFKYKLPPYLLILIFAYLSYSYRKIYMEFGDYRAALWGPVLQITLDIGVISGFISGVIRG